MYIQFHRRKAMKPKVLGKEIDSFKIRLDKKCYSKKYLYFSLLFAVLKVIYLAV